MVSFGEQMTRAVKLLESLEHNRGATTPFEEESPGKGDPLAMLTRISHSIPLSRVAEELTGSMTDNENLVQLKADLLLDLWDRGWKPGTGLPTNGQTNQPGSPDHEQNIRNITRAATVGLSFQQFQEREDFVAEAITETYRWIYDRQPPSQNGGVGSLWASFPDWLERDSDRTYWVTGKPGSGKSTMMKHILASPKLCLHLQKWAGSLPLLITRYYAWNAGVSLQKSLQGLKRTMLLQALDQYPQLLPQVAPRRWAYYTAMRSYKMHFPVWQEWEIDECFENLVLEAGKFFCLAAFIDGMDEFEDSPKEIVNLVNSLASKVSHGIKVCVVSRPWVEFDDAYGDVPSLRMESATQKDMIAFVTEKVRQTKAMIELSTYCDKEVAQFLEDVVHKAEGVFIWLRVVVDTLLQAATEGAGVLQLRQILDSLPQDVRELYDDIWQRIPIRNRKRGAVLLRVEAEQMSFQAKLEPAIFWLADEFAFEVYDPATVDLSQFHNLREKGQGLLEASIKRKLASRTRGLLELGGSSSINFTHRTVLEWLVQPHVRDMMANLSGDVFKLGVRQFLLEMHTLQIPWGTSLSGPGHRSVWSYIGHALYFASKMIDKSEAEANALVKTLDILDAKAQRHVDIERKTGVPSGCHWSSVYLLNNPLEYGFWRRNTFLGLSAQFGITTYIQVKASQGMLYSHPQGPLGTVGLIESAIFGHRAYMLPWYARHSDTSEFIPGEAEKGRRLAILSLLVSHGIRQNSVYVTPENWRPLLATKRYSGLDSMLRLRDGHHDLLEPRSTALLASTTGNPKTLDRKDLRRKVEAALEYHRNRLKPLWPLENVRFPWAGSIGRLDETLCTEFRMAYELAQRGSSLTRVGQKIKDVYLLQRSENDEHTARQTLESSIVFMEERGLDSGAELGCCALLVAVWIQASTLGILEEVGTLEDLR